jgi:hypothetical protein
MLPMMDQMVSPIVPMLLRELTYSNQISPNSGKKYWEETITTTNSLMMLSTKKLIITTRSKFMPLISKINLIKELGSKFPTINVAFKITHPLRSM